MPKTNIIQEFNEKCSAYNVLYNYIKKTQIEFANKNNADISKKYVKKFIQEQGILINSIVIYNPTRKIEDCDQIEINNLQINFKCVFNKNFQDNEEPKPFKEIDLFIHQFLSNNLDTSDLENISTNHTKLAFALVLKIFQDKGFEIVRTSEFSYSLTNFIKIKILTTHIIKELAIQKSQLNMDGFLIETLLQAKANKESKLKLIIQDLLSGQYDNSLFKFLQDYRRLIGSDTFQYIIFPLLDNNIASSLAIENLIKIVRKSSTLVELEDKLQYFEESKVTFNAYFQNLLDTDAYIGIPYKQISEYFFNMLKVHCNTDIERAAIIKVEATNRKYNFNNLNRIEQDIYFTVINHGEGLAKNVIITSLSQSFLFDEINLGILKPNEKREVSTNASLKFDSNFIPKLKIQYKWEEVSGKAKELNSDINFQLQKTEIPWPELKLLNPYSFSIIDSPEKLFGRDEILEELKSNILSENIESYKLWGQKRVGKSSIVKTLKSLFDQYEKTIIIYRPLGGLRNAEAINTLNSLGRSLCSEVYEELDRKIKDPSNRERLRSIEVPTFSGSLFQLEDYIRQLKRIDNSLKFVFILDEFDRINEEFFLPGNLGETLSLSIGKGLNENKYIGFILVGSENMHLLDRHGINYNSYRQKEVDTFHKQFEYNSFLQIVKGPVAPYINFTDEALDKIFTESNGNPYFANLICAEIFKIAYKLKDAEINTQFVNDAVSLIINSSNKSHFEHYWSDGITEESSIMKERKADIRRRILVSFSMLTNPLQNFYPNRNEIERKFKAPLESEYLIEKYEVGNTITEFVNRKIFEEGEDRTIRILPHLFESWLCCKGKTLMIEGVSDLVALQREVDLQIELELKSDELNRIIENYQFKDELIKPDYLSKYFKQFGGATEQRRVFKLFDSIYFIPKQEVINFYKAEKRNVFTKTEIVLSPNAKSIFRDNIELFTFSHNFEENVEIAETFKKMNNIRQQKTLKNILNDSQAWKKSEAEEVIIIEPIIDDFSIISAELFILLNEDIKNTTISIRLITFVITTKAKADLITATSSFNNFKLVVMREIEETKIKPFIQGTEIFENNDEANQAFYEVRKHFPNLSKDVLLILFEDLCPSKSCPILWFKSQEFEPIYHNKHGKIAILNSNEDGEKRRDKLYFFAKELSQKINKFIINYLKTKAQIDGETDWFSLKYIPRRTLDNVSKKRNDEGQTDPLESYFDFIDYKEIIRNLKDSVLEKKFMIGEKEQLEWMNKCNELRRDPAHPEKPCPTVEELDFFEKIKDIILPRLNQ